MKILFTIFALFFSLITSAASLNKMVVFGDSLSDNGNLYEFMKHQLPLCPPYYQGRFTNGPVWVELLMEHYYPSEAKDHMLDYAYGGAGVLEGDDADDDLFTLHRELTTYFLGHGNKADAKTLYVMWIGSNNYLANPDAPGKAVNNVIVGIRHGLEELAHKGAKHVLVVAVPNLGRIPAAREFDAVKEMTAASKKHNKLLGETVTNLKERFPDVQWIFFDINVVFDEMIDNPGLYGFSNVTDTCYEEVMENANENTNTLLKMVATVKPTIKPNACDGFLFFDPVHPTGPAHQLMATRTQMLLAQEGIDFQG